MSWVRVGWLFLALLVVMGCRTSQPHLEPPKERETLNIPPIDDARYNRAEYPQPALAAGKKDRRFQRGEWIEQRRQLGAPASRQLHHASPPPMENGRPTRNVTRCEGS